LVLVALQGGRVSEGSDQGDQIWGDFLSLGIFLKITEEAQIFELISKEKVMY
jgi:hypothetical protein